MISDWGATHATSDLLAGLDVEQPNQDYLNATAIKANLIKLCLSVDTKMAHSASHLNIFDRSNIAYTSYAKSKFLHAKILSYCLI